MQNSKWRDKLPNKKQRLKNRETAKILAMKLPPKIICPECGLRTRTGHFVPPTMGMDDGFWVCPKYYDTHGKRMTA
jgi:hypothetical protein